MSKKKRRNQPKTPGAPSPQSKPAAVSQDFIVPKKIILIACLALLAIGIAVYAPSFNNEFIWDDKIIIPLNEYIATFNIPKLFSTDVHHFSYQPSNFYRPLQMVSYGVNYKLGGYDPFGYHVVNALIHTLNALMLFLIFAQLNERTQTAKARDWQWIALGASLIWLVHPLHTQNVTYTSGRADLLVTLFVLAAFYLHMKRRNIASLACLVGALLSKELAVIAPLFFIAYDFIIEKEEGGLKKQAGFYAGCGVLLCIYAALRLSVFNFPTAFTTEEIPSLGPRLFTSVVSIMLMFSQLVAPRDLSMLRNIEWHKSLVDPLVLASIAVLAALLALALKMRSKEPLISFSLFWFFIAYIPSYNIMPMNANMSEHWMYLPSAFIILLIVTMIWKFACTRRSTALIAFCLVTSSAYAFILMDRNKDFKNEIVFFEELLTHRPDNTRAHYNLGTAYGTSGNYDKAKEHFELAIKHDAKNATAYANLGLIYAKRNDHAKAIELYEKANAMQDNLVENYANLGIAYNMTNNAPKAIEAFNKALQLNPKHPSALNGLGIEAAKKGEFDAAEKYFREVLKYYPDNADAGNNLKRLQALKK